MHPFCSTTAGSLGGSNFWSPNPSATNTIAFCKLPLESATISCAITGDACCLAQTGSAAMLIGLGAGALPWKWTVPRTPDAGVGAGPPAFTRWGTERQRATAIVKNDKNLFPFIEHY